MEEEKPVKPGKKSSEFTLVIAGILATILNAVFDLGVSDVQIISVLGTISGYVGGRSFVKGRN